MDCIVRMGELVRRCHEMQCKASQIISSRTFFHHFMFLLWKSHRNVYLIGVFFTLAQAKRQELALAITAQKKANKQASNRFEQLNMHTAQPLSAYIITVSGFGVRTRLSCELECNLRLCCPRSHLARELIVAQFNLSPFAEQIFFIITFYRIKIVHRSEPSIEFPYETFCLRLAAPITEPFIILRYQQRAS